MRAEHSVAWKALTKVDMRGCWTVENWADEMDVNLAVHLDGMMADYLVDDLAVWSGLQLADELELSLAG